jgi:predicted porin
MKTVVGSVLAVALSAPFAFAQQSPAPPSSPATWNGLSDRFQIDTGYFHLTANSLLRYNGPQGGSGEISLEQDLGVNDKVNTFWLDATWRVGRRHQLKLAFTRFSRDRAGYTLQRDFTWGGQTYGAGLTANTSNSNGVVGGYYRFAIVRNDRFEIGPTLGIGYLNLEARIQATGTVSGPGGSESRTLDNDASIGNMTGALGGYAEVWPARRFVMRGDFLYIKVKPGDSEASVTDWRLGADYYFFKNAGLGVQYKYNKYSEAFSALSTNLGGALVYKGFQVFLSLQF